MAQIAHVAQNNIHTHTNCCYHCRLWPGIRKYSAGGRHWRQLVLSLIRQTGRRQQPRGLSKVEVQ